MYDGAARPGTPRQAGVPSLRRGVAIPTCVVRRSAMETNTRTWVKDPEILLVDDDDDLRESIAEGLEDAGFIVIRASDGADALGHLRTSNLPALVLLDLLMPGM